MFAGWITIFIRQTQGIYIIQKYPTCRGNIDFQSIGDGKCDAILGFQSNIFECGKEGGDCKIFNQRYPNCNVEKPCLVGNGVCNGAVYNIEKCGCDGGDCIIPQYPNCIANEPSWVGDGTCFSQYNIAECGWDGGDCIELNFDLHIRFPNCTGFYPKWVGDGRGDGDNYNTVECGYYHNLYSAVLI